MGGTITVWNDAMNEAWMFMKEISSDGDVSTVSIYYPSWLGLGALGRGSM